MPVLEPETCEFDEAILWATEDQVDDLMNEIDQYEETLQDLLDQVASNPEPADHVEAEDLTLVTLEQEIENAEVEYQEALDRLEAVEAEQMADARSSSG